MLLWAPISETDLPSSASLFHSLFKDWNSHQPLQWPLNYYFSILVALTHSNYREGPFYAQCWTNIWWNPSTYFTVHSQSRPTRVSGPAEVLLCIALSGWLRFTFSFHRLLWQGLCEERWQKVTECNDRKANFLLPLRTEVDFKEMHPKPQLNNCLSSHQHQRMDSVTRGWPVLPPSAFLPSWRPCLKAGTERKGFHNSG